MARARLRYEALTALLGVGMVGAVGQIARADDDAADRQPPYALQ
jgi:hypothetical protein